MFKLSSVVCIVFLFCSIIRPNLVCAQVRLDSAFINWNKATFESLNRQTQLAADSMQKAMYKNRLIAVKEYWRVRDLADFNDKSIRYKLLKAVFAKHKDKKKSLYIIEANESGSKVLLRSYVLCIGSTGIVDVEFYDFFNDRWQKTGKFTKDNFKLQGDLKMYISKFGKGFNNDDIVVTKFENGRVKSRNIFCMVLCQVPAISRSY